MTISLSAYRMLRLKVAVAGYAFEIDWAQGIRPPTSAIHFWREYSWVVLNSGMREQVARVIWQRVFAAVTEGCNATTVFGHKGKAAAIDSVYKDRERLLREYLAADDKLSFLEGLPWIGGITRWHLAKNLGMDVAKPDRHLVRIAGAEGVEPMCRRLSVASGDRIATVDSVIWRAANLGIV